MFINVLTKATPAELAEILLVIKTIGNEKSWIRKTQVKQLDLILTQLYRAQAKLACDNGGTP